MENHKEQAEDVETQRYDPPAGEPRMRINNLAPPAGTSYFARQTVTFFNNAQIGTSPKVGEFTWKADVYTYATGARPTDPNFAQKGRVNVILVHTGFVRFYDNFDADVWDELTFSLSPLSSGLLPTLQLPSTGSGTPSGDDFNYEIKYGEKMAMFNNDGNQSFTFDASYEERFTRIKAKQTGSRAGFIEFGVQTTGKSSNHRTTEIYGLSMFTHNNPAAFPLSIQRSFTSRMPGQGYAWSIWGNVTLNLGF